MITMGTPEQAAAFRERLELPFPCFADPERAAYKAFGIPRASLGQLAGPAVWIRGGRALWRHGGGLPVGDPRQLHAAFVIDTHGGVRFVHYPRHAADLPSHHAMIAVIAQL